MMPALRLPSPRIAPLARRGFRALAAVTLLACSVVGIATAATPEKFGTLYRQTRILARVDGTHAWHAQPDDYLTGSHFVLGDDGGVLLVTRDESPTSAHGRLYLYSPTGGWSTLMDSPFLGVGGSPTATESRYYTFSRGGGVAPSAQGVYVIDTHGGYDQPPVTRVTHWSAGLTSPSWDNPTRLADGRIAFALRGITGLAGGAQVWGIADGFDSFTPLLASKPLDPASQFDRLCIPSINAKHGFVGCGYVGDTPYLHYSLSDITFSGHVTGYSGSATEFNPAPAIDSAGNSAWPVADTPGNVRAIYAHRASGGYNGYLWSKADEPGIKRIPAYSSLAVRPHPDGLELIFQGVIPDPNDPADDDVAIFSVSGWRDSTTQNPTLVFHRIIGRRDAVRLEDGRTAYIDEDQVLPLTPWFSVNSDFDIAFIAKLVTLDDHGIPDDAGTGLFVIERGIFGDGFDD